MPLLTPEYAIEVHGLTKVYKGSRRRPPTTALKGLDLTIPRGSIFGLLGPNGAGKSTLINILAGLVVKSGGDAKIWGHDIVSEMRMARNAIGIVPQELNLDAFFTPYELLELQAGLYGVPKKERRTEELLAAVDLSDKAHAYARTLSGGMRRRLMVAKAMVHTPPVLVLDEPTAGVDVELRQALWSYVRKLNEQGTTILLTTHYLEEAEKMCDRIAIINHGELVANDSKRNLLAKLDNKEIVITVERDLTLLPAALQEKGFELVGARQMRLHYRPSQARLDEILPLIQESGLTIIDLSTHEADLEDIFIQLTQRKAA